MLLDIPPQSSMHLTPEAWQVPCWCMAYHDICREFLCRTFRTWTMQCARSMRATRCHGQSSAIIWPTAVTRLLWNQIYMVQLKACGVTSPMNCIEDYPPGMVAKYCDDATCQDCYVMSWCYMPWLLCYVMMLHAMTAILCHDATCHDCYIMLWCCKPWLLYYVMMLQAMTAMLCHDATCHDCYIMSWCYMPWLLYYVMMLHAMTAILCHDATCHDCYIISWCYKPWLLYYVMMLQAMAAILCRDATCHDGYIMSWCYRSWLLNGAKCHDATVYAREK